MSNFARNLLLWTAIFCVVLVTINLMQGNMGGQPQQQPSFSQFLSDVESGKVASVSIRQSAERGTEVSGAYENGLPFQLQAPNYPGLVDTLRENNVSIRSEPPTSGMDSFLGIFLGWLPILVLIGVYLFVMKQMQSGGGIGGRGGAMGFGKSRARLLTEKNAKVTFDNVAGIEEAKEELEEIVDYLKDPGRFQKLGGRIPRGVLLVGPPGTGKTLLARAIAGEAGVPFFSISGSDFVEMFVGVGASRVRDMFEQGKKNAPCIIFIDEIDAVGRHRGAGMGGGNDEREQTLNQLLVEMDGFEENDSVIIIAATNRPDVLDQALLRPGRFDRQVVVPNPDILGREQILKVHLKKVPMAPDVDPHVIARGTPGFSGADLSNLVNEAALLAARRGKKVVTMRELENAKDKVMMGAERKSMVMKDEEKRLTAYHEAGHAIIALHMPASDPIHKATIIPRGRALGMVMRLPESDKLSYSREKMVADLAVSMGGRVAEELIFGHDKVTSGASSDIQYATRMAKAMVMEWGMSDELGPIFYGSSGNDEGYMAGGGRAGVGISEDAARRVDAEVKRIVSDAHDTARRILTENAGELEILAQGLLEYETLSGDEIKALLEGDAPRREDVSGKRVVRRSTLRKKAGGKQAEGGEDGEGDSPKAKARPKKTSGGAKVVDIEKQAKEPPSTRD